MLLILRNIFLKMSLISFIPLISDCKMKTMALMVHCSDDALSKKATKLYFILPAQL